MDDDQCRRRKTTKRNEEYQRQNAIKWWTIESADASTRIFSLLWAESIDRRRRRRRPMISWNFISVLTTNEGQNNVNQSNVNITTTHVCKVKNNLNKNPNVKTERPVWIKASRKVVLRKAQSDSSEESAQSATPLHRCVLASMQLPSPQRKGFGHEHGGVKPSVFVCLFLFVFWVERWGWKGGDDMKSKNHESKTHTKKKRHWADT